MTRPSHRRIGLRTYRPASQTARLLFELEKTRRERLQILQEVTELAVSSLNSREVAERTQRYLLERLHVSVVTVWVVDESRTALRRVSAAGFSPEFFEQFAESVPLDSPLEVAKAFRDRRPVVRGSERVGEVSERVRAAFEAHGAPLQALLVLPVRGHRADIGAVTLAWKDPRSFADEDVEFFMSIVNSLGVAMENALLFEQKAAAQRVAQSELDMADLLLHAANGLAEWTDLDTTLARLAEIVLERSAHSRVTVELWDEGRQALTVVVSKGASPVASCTNSFEALSASAQVAIISRMPALADYELVSDAESCRLAEARAAQLELIVPIVYRDRALGLLVVDSPHEHMDFQLREIHMIEAIAAQAATAIENGRLYDSVCESNERVTSVLDSIGDAFFALNRDWRFSFVNPEAERILQRTAGDLLGQGIWDVFADAVGSVFYTEYQRVMDTGEPAAFEEYYEPLDLWADVRAYPWSDGISVFFRDVSERRAAEEALRRSRERADMLSGLLDDSSQPFMVGDTEGRFMLHNRAFEELTGYSAAELASLVWPDDVTTPETLHEEHQAIAAINRTDEPQRFEKEFLRKDGTRVPAEVLRHGHRTTDGEIDYYYAFMTDISERKAAQAAIEAERRRLREVIDDVPLGITLFDAKGAAVEVNDANRRIWRGDVPLVAWAGDYCAGRLFRLDSGEPIPPEETAAARVLATGEPAADIVEIERFDGTRARVQFSATPITDAEGRLSRVVLITEDVTQALEARRLDEALNAIGTAVTTTLDSEEILARLVKLSAEAVGVETAGLALTEDRGWVNVETFGMPVSTKSALTDPKLLAALSGAPSHSPIVVNDTASDPRVSSAVMRRLGIKSLMAVPILAQHAVVGALVFHHRVGGIAFTAEQAEFAARLMDIATLALENARLYEREHRIANTLQAAVLTPPEQVPGVESAFVYRPASNTANIGGDFYDVFAIDDDHLGLVIGDVSGKGIDAARLTSLMHDGIRAYAYEEWHPAHVLSRMNKLVHRLSPSDTFATMFFAVLEPSSGKLYHCTAGHPHPVIVNANTSRVLEGGRSQLLGAFAEGHFEEAELALEVGEMLVLYTDGITEARADREMFGEARLLATLTKFRHTPTYKMPQRLLAAAVKFAEGRLHDDTVVLSIKWTGLPADRRD